MPEDGDVGHHPFQGVRATPVRTPAAAPVAEVHSSRPSSVITRRLSGIRERRR
ncbi:hypothetical protein [Amycolatopsis sp. lyj-112]|uniref:hypothetical protein n=1 Tax=Amycolatopsis sp. lyj-112 TaxID=2789288 RepID=UPI00397A24BD